MIFLVSSVSHVAKIYFLLDYDPHVCLTRDIARAIAETLNGL